MKQHEIVKQADNEEKPLGKYYDAYVQSMIEKQRETMRLTPVNYTWSK
jgi:hypothetical protein